MILASKDTRNVSQSDYYHNIKIQLEICFQPIRRPRILYTGLTERVPEE